MSDTENKVEQEVDTSNMSIAKQRKYRYAAALKAALAKYTKVLIINVDNVGSYQLQKVRKQLRGTAEVLMGKNTVIRKILREHADPEVQALEQFIDGNIGFVFTNESLKDIKDVVTLEKTPASAKVGMYAPVDVILPAGPTGLDPGQTSFFQAMNIGTRITRGAIEITNAVTLCIAGDKVSSTAVALMSKMELRPFEFGIRGMTCMENGQIFPASILDTTDDTLIASFLKGVARVASISLAIGYPTLASVPHSVVNAFRNLLFVSLGCGYEFKESKQYLDLLSDPEALAAAQAAAAAASAPAGDAAAAAKEESEEEESDDDDDDDDSDDLFG